jgi:hypothetical protein
MTELMQAPAGLGLEKRDAGSQGGVVVELPPSFSELVAARYAWWHARRNGDSKQADETYREMLRRFEAIHGFVISAFWGSHLESGIALTERKRRFPRRTTLRLHRDTDAATRHWPEIAAELHRCDELAVRGRSVLTGVRQRICLHLVAAAAAHLLSVADRATTPSDSHEAEVVLKRERQSIDKAWRYYEQAANGQAQIIYFAGMTIVALAVSLSAGLFLSVEQWRVGVAALVAGSVGAVISVVQRINTGGFHVEYDVGRPYAFFLGGLRPLIGGAFAIAIAYAFDSGILHLPIGQAADTEQKHLALIVLSFLAGFSERWAQDTLATAVPQAAAKPAAEGPEVR